MVQVRTGYKRSLTVMVTKKINSQVAPGYPKQYPTATDMANGYFTYLGTSYTIPTPEELGLMSQLEYDYLLLRFKQYIYLSESGFVNDSFVNQPEVYDPDVCVPGKVEEYDFGYLYNYISVLDVRGIAPAGYRVATLSDIQDLLSYLGGSNIAGGKLKSVEEWAPPNLGATNEYGFNALPSGSRNESGVFSGVFINSRTWIDYR